MKEIEYKYTFEDIDKVLQEIERIQALPSIKVGYLPEIHTRLLKALDNYPGYVTGSSPREDSEYQG